MKLNIDKKAVGSRIRTIRLDRGLTLDEFGKILDTTKSVVFRWENGTALPNKERIKTICKLFDITRNELLYGSIVEVIKNNIKYFCKELNYTELELLELIINDKFKEKVIDININLEDTKIFEEIILSLYSLIDEIKEEFEVTIDLIKSLNIKDEWVKNDNIAIVVKNKKQLYFNLENFYNFVDNHKNQFSIIDLINTNKELENYLLKHQLIKSALEIRKLKEQLKVDYKKNDFTIIKRNGDIISFNLDKISQFIFKLVGDLSDYILEDKQKELSEKIYNKLLKQLEKDEKTTKYR